jgi:hypothetical protein
VLFIAAIGFAAAAAFVWYRDQSNDTDEPSVPTAEAGVYGLINVLTALQDADISADYGPLSSHRDIQPARPAGAEPPGWRYQCLHLYFPGRNGAAAAEARAAAAANLDPATMTLLTTSGQDVTNGEPLTVYQGANIIAVLVGGDAEMQTQVQNVIEGLS